LVQAVADIVITVIYYMRAHIPRVVYCVDYHVLINCVTFRGITYISDTNTEYTHTHTHTYAHTDAHSHKNTESYINEYRHAYKSTCNEGHNMKRDNMQIDSRQILSHWFPEYNPYFA